MVSQGGTASPTPAPGGIAGTGVTVLADVSAHSQVAPPPPPATWGGYAKKSGESTGVIAMVDLLVKVKLRITENVHSLKMVPSNLWKILCCRVMSCNICTVL